MAQLAVLHSSLYKLLCSWWEGFSPRPGLLHARCELGSLRAPTSSPSGWLVWTLVSAMFQPWLLHGTCGGLPEKPSREPPCSECRVPCPLVTDNSSFSHVSTLSHTAASCLEHMSSPSKSQSPLPSITHAHSARPQEGDRAYHSGVKWELSSRQFIFLFSGFWR